MSESPEGGSKFTFGFAVGFLVGVVICLGVGGTFALTYAQRNSKLAAAEEAEARMHAERAAEAQKRAEEALLKQKAAEKKAMP